MLRRLVFLFFPFLLFAQYNQEMVTEKNYENSDIYFKSHFFNTQGIYRFKEVAAGLIDDPFLNMYINPARLPKLDSTGMILYLNFRGDRTEPEVVQQYAYPLYLNKVSYGVSSSPDLRTAVEARNEPEPVISVGFMLNPLRARGKDFYVAGSYQMIHKNDKYYDMPYYIYRSNLYYDAFGNYKSDLSNLPVVDRESGKDEMTNNAHLFTLSSGLAIDENLSVGIAVNGVFHKRDGGYGRTNNDEFGNSNSYDYYSVSEEIRTQKYHHWDFSAGVQYKTVSNFILGVKAGLLTGVSEQFYSSINDYQYNNHYNQPAGSFYINGSLSSNIQNWKHDGQSYYLSFDLNKILPGGKTVNFYYTYNYCKEDITNSTSILDTSRFTSHWYSNYYNGWYNDNYYSLLLEARSASGAKKTYDHKAMLAYNWQITESTLIALGLYYNYTKSTISTDEPVNSTRQSINASISPNTANNYNYNYASLENKNMLWDLESTTWTFQIPIWLHHKFNSYLGCILGINRVVSETDITDVTLAVYKRRWRNDNGTVTENTNFGERYTEPGKKFTETTTDIVGGFTLDVTDDFGMKLLFDPESDPNFRIAQWSLSLAVRM